ncbi:hypothetical protein C8R43DRAFT_1033888 [Mycena crocata]|nr:hypothetical protein C8R43DRAFT_1033888 [Mycena crocata]
MLHWKDFSAWISIDGTETPEYDIEMSEDKKTVTCWIASELGKTFSIHWRNSSYHHDTSGIVKMDGNSCGGQIIYGRTLPRSAVKSGVTVAHGSSIKPFMFSSLTLTDDDTYLGGSSHQDLGVIELVIYPVKVSNSRGATSTGKDLSALKVHERSKKAVTQQITLAQPKKLEVPFVFVSAPRSGPDLAKFLFKYRPLDILRANGIAPPQSSKERKASVEPERAPTPQKASLLHTPPELKEKKPRIKREAGGPVIDLTEDRPSKRVKTETIQPFIPGEIIDLT